MNITTKFKIGDIVWIVDDSFYNSEYMRRGTIKQIEATIYLNKEDLNKEAQESMVIFYRIKEDGLCNMFREDNVFLDVQTATIEAQKFITQLKQQEKEELEAETKRCIEFLQEHNYEVMEKQGDK